MQSLHGVLSKDDANRRPSDSSSEARHVPARRNFLSKKTISDSAVLLADKKKSDKVLFILLP